MIDTIINIMEFLPFIGIAGFFNPGTPGVSKFKTRGPYSGVDTGDTGVNMTNPITGQISGTIDTGNIDFNNKDQIMAIQQAMADQGLVGKDGNPIAVDGMFGENTEHAYRQYINDRRTSQGKDAYGYGTNNVNDTVDANANLGPTQGPQNQDYGNFGEVFGPPSQNNNGYNGPFLDGGNNNNLGPVQGPDNFDNNDYTGPYSSNPVLTANPGLTDEVSEETGEPDWLKKQNMVSDYDISPGEARARDRAASGKYVWNRKHRQKYAPGTTLWDMFK